MKKRTLLTFVATSAVVVTTAASYAVWDITKTTEQATITVGKGFAISSTDLIFNGILADSINGKSEVESDFTVSIDGDVAGKKLIFTTTEMSQGGASNADAVIVKVMDDVNDVTAAGDETLDKTNSYKVKVALPTNSNAADYEEKEIKFNLNAELVAK